MHSHFLEKPPLEQILSTCQFMPVCLPISLFSMTTGITLQSSVCSKVLTSITRSLYFSILSYSLLSTLQSPGHVKSTILHTFLPLCTMKICRRLCCKCLSVCTVMSHKTFRSLFSVTITIIIITVISLLFGIFNPLSPMSAKWHL